MRIVDLPAFMALPAQTVYHLYEPCNTGPLSIKGDNCHGMDWVEQVLDGMPQSNGSDQLFDRLDEMENNGTVFPLEVEGTSRHGLYPDQQLFMIYDPADLDALILLLKGC